MSVLSEEVARFVRSVGPEPDAIQREMHDYAREHGFPIIGPDVGGLLRLLARAGGVRRAFEFGSGFGYSASWIAPALPVDGEIVLTEVDADELDLAREFFRRAGYADRARFESGDAVEIVTRYDGPFGLVLLDHEKHRYVEGFEAVREKITPGGIVVADNVMRGPVAFEDVLAGVEGGATDLDESTRGIVDYLERVRSDRAFETVVVPVGNGIAVSVRRAGVA